jgi:hypothetical protein
MELTVKDFDAIGGKIWLYSKDGATYQDGTKFWKYDMIVHSLTMFEMPDTWTLYDYSLGNDVTNMVYEMLVGGYTDEEVINHLIEMVEREGMEPWIRDTWREWSP